MMEAKIKSLSENPFLTRSTISELLSTKARHSDLLKGVLQQGPLLGKTHGFLPDRAVEIADSIGQWWPAKMIQLQSGRILCRYDGWGPEHDEWIDSDSQRLRMKETIVSSPDADRQDISSVQLVSGRDYRRTSVKTTTLDRPKHVPSEQAILNRKKKYASPLK